MTDPNKTLVLQIEALLAITNPVPPIPGLASELLAKALAALRTEGQPAPAVSGVRVKSGIYTASKTVHAQKWRELRAAGTPVIASWIDEAGVGETDDFADLWRRCIGEASRAAAVVLYREPGEVLKGAFIEAGAALAVGTPVHAVGCSEFSFVNHPLVTQHPNLSSAILAALESAPAAETREAFRYCDGCDGYNCSPEAGCAYPAVPAPEVNVEKAVEIALSWDIPGHVDAARETARGIAKEIAALPHLAAEWRPTHRHVVTGGEYMRIGIGKMQAGYWFETPKGRDHGSRFEEVDMREVAIYIGKDGWRRVCPREEFEEHFREIKE